MTNILSLPLLDAAPARPSTNGLPARSARLLAALGRPVRYHLVTLGCPKNTVDSDSFERRLRAFGCQPTATPDAADVLVANTCGFIEQSQEQSINAVLALASARRSEQKLITAGCLVTLNRDDLARELPEVDAFFDPREWDGTVASVAGYGLLPDVTVSRLERAIGSLEAGEHPASALAGMYAAKILASLPEGGRLAPGMLTSVLDGAASDTLSIARYDIPSASRGGRVSAYLKISDGCNAPCTFCIIPQIKGRLASERPAELAAQARLLREEGARELVLVAQDSTAYGEDLGVRDALPDLLRLLAETVPDVWLRLMYAYPGRVSERLTRTMAELPSVVHYLDVPLQHGSAATLKRMRRPANLGMVRRMIADLRAAMPDIALRTSFITGFPDETDAEFQELLEFVEEIQFDHVGVFTYSQQERAVSGSFADQVPERVKRSRRKRVMEAQQRISLAKHRALVGSELTVLVESEQPEASGPVVMGRSYRDAPEVDGTVSCRGTAKPGEFVRVRVTEAMPYDLAGEIIGRAKPWSHIGGE